MRWELGIEVSGFLSELVVGPLNVGNTGGRTVQGRVPFWICGLGWRHPLPGSCEWLWNSAEAISISYKPYVKHLFNLHKYYYFQITDEKPAIFPHVPCPPQPCPTFILTILSPSLIPSSVSLMLLVSFHPRCPHPALIFSFAWTNWTACLWSPACDIHPSNSHPDCDTCVHTHICYISSPFPLEHCVQPTVYGFPEQLQSTPTCSFLAAHRCVLQARLDSALQGLGFQSAHAPPLSQPRLSCPTSRLKWSVTICLMHSSFHCFSARLLLIIGISVHLVWWLVICTSAPPQVHRCFRAGTSPHHYPQEVFTRWLHE